MTASTLTVAGSATAGLSYPDIGWDPDRGRDDDPDERASQADLDLLATLFPDHDQRHDDHPARRPAATPSTTTPSTSTTRAPPTRLAECPTVNCPTLT